MLLLYNDEKILCQQEPEDSGKIDEARLYAAIEEKRQEWDEAMRRKAKAIAARDLQQIEKQLGDLKRHLELTRGQYGDSLMAARECSASFSAFEETIDVSIWDFFHVIALKFCRQKIKVSQILFDSIKKEGESFLFQLCKVKY